MAVRNGEGVPEGYNLGAVAGRAFERERIIKLLKPLAKHEHKRGDCWPEDCDAFVYEHVIALIKGEEA